MFTEEEKSDITNYLCRGGLTVVGMATGAPLGAPGIIGAGTAAFVYSKKACKYLNPGLKKKIWGSDEPLSEVELRKLSSSIQTVAPDLTRSEILGVIDQSRRYSKKQKQLFQAQGLS